jgi:hypothetical protein
MKVRAIRGVCIDVGRHMSVGDVEDLAPALVNYLVGIGAVERVPDEPPTPDLPAPEPELEPIPESKPAKAGSKEK